jgi:prepilin-type N-terminal cleavage/methylation domain-containing protein
MKTQIHRAKTVRARSVSRGFTLVEMAMVLVIMGLLLGGGLTLLSTQIEQQKVKGTERQLEEVKEALIGFALANGRLPCPADPLVPGVELNPCNTEATASGLIPWTTLGVNRLDGWNKVIRYSVTPAFASRTTLFSLSTLGTKIVQTRNATGATVALANQVPAVIFSHGRRSFGTTDAGVPIPNESSGATNLDEAANNTATVNFIQRTFSEGTGSAFGGEYDDMVTWLSPNILFSRMVQAGTLP